MVLIWWVLQLLLKTPWRREHSLPFPNMPTVMGLLDYAHVLMGTESRRHEPGAPRWIQDVAVDAATFTTCLWSQYFPPMPSSTLPQLPHLPRVLKSHAADLQSHLSHVTAWHALYDTEAQLWLALAQCWYTHSFTALLTCPKPVLRFSAGFRFGYLQPHPNQQYCSKVSAS